MRTFPGTELFFLVEWQIGAWLKEIIKNEGTNYRKLYLKENVLHVMLCSPTRFLYCKNS